MEEGFFEAELFFAGRFVEEGFFEAELFFAARLVEEGFFAAELFFAVELVFFARAFAMADSTAPVALGHRRSKAREIRSSLRAGPRSELPGGVELPRAPGGGRLV